MNREIWWASVEDIGLEHLRVTATDRGLIAEGTVLSCSRDKPFDLRYRVECDGKWRVSSVKVSRRNSPEDEIALESDGEGNWTDERGESLSPFRGCYDIDISATPLTNTLPIRRIGLDVGQSAEISVIYFLIPEMTFQRSLQRYSRLENGLYKFEEKGVFDGFSAEIRVDRDGFVTDYPELFRRIGWR